MMKLIDDKLPDDVELIGNPQEIGIVVCRRCEQQIGRLQPTPVERSREEAKVYTEVRQLVEEHRPQCPGHPQ